MRSLFKWFTTRRLLVGVALSTLVVLGVLSAGRTPERGEQVTVPDLGFLILIGLGLFALIGAVLIAFGKPRKGGTSPRENRSLRTVLVMVLIIGAATILFAPDGPGDDPLLPEEEQAPLIAEPQGGGEEGFLAGENADIVALLFAGLIVVAGVVQVLRRPRSLPSVPAAPSVIPDEVEPAVRRASRHLHTESEPGLAVLLAYHSLEQSLADFGHPRRPAETPGEHMSRVLSVIPPLEGPGRQLGELFEIARFSNRTITEDNRQDARKALDEALASLPVRVEESG